MGWHRSKVLAKPKPGIITQAGDRALLFTCFSPNSGANWRAVAARVASCRSNGYLESTIDWLYISHIYLISLREKAFGHSPQEIYLLNFGATCPRSSVDRAPASGAGCGGSIPPGGTISALLRAATRKPTTTGTGSSLSRYTLLADGSHRHQLPHSPPADPTESKQRTWASRHLLSFTIQNASATAFQTSTQWCAR